MKIKFFNIRCEAGFSMAEVTIGVGILGISTLAGTLLMKNVGQSKKALDQDTDMYAFSKAIENRLISKEGCNYLVKKKVGSNLNFMEDVVKVRKVVRNSKSKENVVSGTSIQATELKLAEFISYERDTARPDFSAGLARISLSLKRLNSDNQKKYDIFVPVNFERTKAGVQFISGCNSSYLQTYLAIKDMVCPGTFGSNTKGKTCAEAIVMVQWEARRRVCEELYGRPVALKNGHCDLSLIHANKSCPAGSALRGFDSKAQPICLALPPGSTP